MPMPQVDPIQLDMRGATMLGLQMQQLGQTQELRDIQEERLKLQQQRELEGESLKARHEQARVVFDAARSVDNPIERLKLVSQGLSIGFGKSIPLTGADMDLADATLKMNQIVEQYGPNSPEAQQAVAKLQQVDPKRVIIGPMMEMAAKHREQQGRQQLAQGAGLNYSPQQLEAIGSDKDLAAKFAQQTSPYAVGQIQAIQKQAQTLLKDNTINTEAMTKVAPFRRSGMDDLEAATPYVKTLNRLEAVKDDKTRSQIERINPAFQGFKDELQQRLPSVIKDRAGLYDQLNQIKDQMSVWESDATKDQSGPEYRAMQLNKQATQAAFDLRTAQAAFYSKPTGANYRDLKAKQQGLDKIYSSLKANADQMRQHMSGLNNQLSLLRAGNQEVQKFTQELQGAGIDPASPEGQKRYEELVTKQTTHPPAAQTTIQNYTPANVEIQKQQAEALIKTQEKLQDVPTQIENLHEARHLIGKSVPFVGSFGETKFEIAKFFNNNLGTHINPEGIANAGELRTRIFQNVMDNLKKMDAQPSQLQQKIMMDALGDLNQDPKALDRMLGAYEDVLRGKVTQHNKRAAEAKNKGLTFVHDPEIKLPGAYQPDKSYTDIIDEELAFGDKDKEARYQKWKQSQGK